jgi:hypothetical protein
MESEYPRCRGGPTKSLRRYGKAFSGLLAGSGFSPNPVTHKYVRSNDFVGKFEVYLDRFVEVPGWFTTQKVTQIVTLVLDAFVWEANLYVSDEALNEGVSLAEARSSATHEVAVEDDPGSSFVGISDEPLQSGEVTIAVDFGSASALGEPETPIVGAYILAMRYGDGRRGGTNPLPFRMVITMRHNAVFYRGGVGVRVPDIAQFFNWGRGHRMVPRLTFPWESTLPADFSAVNLPTREV